MRHARVCPQRQELPLPTTQSKHRSATADTYPRGKNKNRAFAFTPATVTFASRFGARTPAATLRLHTAFLFCDFCLPSVHVLPPSLSLSLALALLSSLPSLGRRCVKRSQLPTPRCTVTEVKCAWASSVQTRWTNELACADNLVQRLKKNTTWVVCTHFAKVAPYSRECQFEGIFSEVGIVDAPSDG